jgi:hypothetical protein
MRSPKASSVGNGWYWLAGVLAALVGLGFYLSIIRPILAIIRPILPALAWHGTHSRTMQFAEFHLDVPLFWYVPSGDIRQPNDISTVGVYKAIYPGQFFGSIVLLKSKPGSCTGCFDRSREAWAKMYGASAATPITFPLASDSMKCLYHEMSPYVSMSCFREKKGAALEFYGSKQDYLKLHDMFTRKQLFALPVPSRKPSISFMHCLSRLGGEGKLRLNALSRI